MTLRFREASPGDLPGLVALVNTAYRGEASRVGWTTEADVLAGQRIDAEMLAAELATDGAHLVVADDDEGIAGCFRLDLAEGSRDGYVGMISVPPSRQGQGVGDALLAEAERRTRGAGCERLRMQVIWVRDELLSFYARRGYLPTGERTPFPYGDERFGRPLRDDLAFVVLTKDL